MSVTFTTTRPMQDEPHVLTCCPDTRSEPFPTADAAWAARNTAQDPILDCPNEDCRDWGRSFVEPVTPEPEVNLSNRNARDLLTSLGIDASEDLCGTMDASAFRERLLIALATQPDHAGAMPTLTSGGPGSIVGGPVWVDCGREPGYFIERYGWLMEVVDAAESGGWQVTWS